MGLPKYGLDKVIFSSGNSTVLHIGAGRITIWLFVVNFNFIFSIGQRFRAGRYKISHLQQYLPVRRKLVLTKVASFGFKFQLNKFIATFSLDTCFLCKQVLLQFLLQRRGCGWTKWLYDFFKISFKFVAVTSFRFVAFMFFCCCGLGQNSEAFALFGCFGFVLFSVTFFQFIPQVAVLLFSRCSFRWTSWLHTFYASSF